VSRAPSRRSAAGAFLHGIAVSIRTPHLALALWIGQAILAMALALPVANALHGLLEHAPVSDRLLHAPDASWWATVRRTHPDLVGNLPEAVEALLSARGVGSFNDFAGTQGIGAAALGLALLAILFHAFLLGGVLGSLHENSKNLITFAAQAAARFPAFLVITIASFFAAVGIYHGVFYLAGGWLLDRAQNFSTERAAFAMTAVRVAVLLGLLGFIKLAADTTRILWVERPDLPTVSRFLVGIGTAIGRFGRLLSTLLLYSLAGVGLYLLWPRIAPNAGAATTGGLVLLVIAQQAFVFVRSILRVGYYVGARSLIVERPSRPVPEETAAPQAAPDRS
jgi:hypothetical protein